MRLEELDPLLQHCQAIGGFVPRRQNLAAGARQRFGLLRKLSRGALASACFAPPRETAPRKNW